MGEPLVPFGFASLAFTGEPLVPPWAPSLAGGGVGLAVAEPAEVVWGRARVVSLPPG
jgi:hypothetical protein